MAGDERRVKVKVDHVEEIYDGHKGKMIVLNGVDLDIMENELICAVGLLGCGKLTLLDVIAGLLEPTSGAVYMDGNKVEGAGIEHGVVFQQYALFPWLTMPKNVMFGPKPKGMNEAKVKELVMKYIKMVELEDSADTYPKELPGGMKQRAAITRTYAVQPEVPLTDEPFGALDAQTRTQPQSELIKTWQEEKKTCFFITHDVEEAVILVTKVIIMSARSGRIKKIVDINLPYPRTQEMKMELPFLDSKFYIWGEVYQGYLEVRK